MFRADLHCHSTCSDGTMTPIELIDLALSQGLSGLAITDHDTVSAYEEALEYAQEKNFQLLSGVEFSAFHLGESVHLLGYGFRLDHEAIQSLCQRHVKRRIERATKILEKLADRGMPIVHEEIIFSAFGVNQKTKGAIVGRPHIAQVMVQKGYVSSITEAFHKYLGDGRPCCVETSTVSARETVDCIHEAGGYAVIAHPHLIPHSFVIRDLQNMDFDGIEVYYGNLPKHREERGLRMANKKEWMITGGSDFHGSVKPHIRLGASWVGEETFSKLYERFLKHHPQFAF
ncbi:MAG: phosphatase [Waddliaceae bacterium]|nr:phosphatase [Waddliaceae bacterium]